MNKFLFVFYLSVSTFFTLQAQEFKIVGRFVSDRPVKLIQLKYTTGKNDISDSTTLKNGRFTFSNKLTETTLATLIFRFELANGEKRPRIELKYFYIEPCNIEIDIKDSVKFAKITGSKSQIAYEEFTKMLEPYTAKSIQITSVIMKNLREGNSTDSKKNASIYQAIEQEKKEKVYLPYVLQNPNSPIALALLRTYAGFDFEASKIEPIFESFPLSVQKSPSGLVFRENIEIEKKAGIGAYALPFTQNDTIGKPVSLSSFKGKFVLLDFWASWCSPCRHENPNVVKAFHQFKDKNFTVLSVSLDRPDKHQAWMDAIHADGLTWTHVSDLKFWKNEVAVLYGITAIPQNFLIDPTGKIIAKNIKGEELFKKLNEVLPK
ncbi:MAG: TlpA disulfide reductase family protein [Prolixibacteraceae bacterium]